MTATLLVVAFAAGYRLAGVLAKARATIDLATRITPHVFTLAPQARQGGDGPVPSVAPAPGTWLAPSRAWWQR